MKYIFSPQIDQKLHKILQSLCQFITLYLAGLCQFIILYLAGLCQFIILYLAGLYQCMSSKMVTIWFRCKKLEHFAK